MGGGDPVWHRRVLPVEGTMTRNDRSYYERRAEDELKAAEASDHPRAVKAHYMLAGYYLDLVHAQAERALQPAANTEVTYLRVVR
jgi:hypothetical protein